MDQFFPQRKRRVNLLRPILLRKDSNKRIQLQFSMPLEGENLAEMPQYISDAFEPVNKEHSTVPQAPSSTELEAMNVKFYVLDSTKAVDIKLIGCSIGTFRVMRKKSEGDIPSDLVSLYMTITCAYRTAIYTWAGDNAGNTMWAEFETTQQTIEAQARKEPEATQMTLGGDHTDPGTAEDEIAAPQRTQVPGRAMAAMTEMEKRASRSKPAKKKVAKKKGRK